jgi:hypothetical protein
MGNFLEYLLIIWLGLRAFQVIINFLRIAASNTIGKLFGVDAALGTVEGAPVWFIVKPEMVAHFLTAALGVSGWFVRRTENAEIDALQGVHADDL